MRPACTVLLLLTGCAPLPSGTDEQAPRLLEDDFVLDPSSQDRVGRFDQAVTTGDGANGAHILFLNFDGATIARGNDNPSLNRSFIPNSTTTVIPPFDDTKFSAVYTRAQAIDAVLGYANGFYAAYNVQIVTTRPASGRYTMMMVGGTAMLVGSGGSVVGIAPLDCGNGNESNVGFAFSASLIPSARTTKSSADTALRELALTIVHEAGHSYGLEHSANQTDIMYPSVSPGQTGFNGAAAYAQPPSQCSNGTTQNTGALLANNIGTRVGGPPDLGGGTPDLGTKPPDLGGANDAGAPKDQGTSKDQGGFGEADLAGGGGDPGTEDPSATLDGGSGKRTPGGGCQMGGADRASQPWWALALVLLLAARHSHMASRRRRAVVR